jgi:hypothetical protein
MYSVPPAETKYITDMLEYNVKGGKMNRGLTVVDSGVLIFKARYTSLPLYLSISPALSFISTSLFLSLYLSLSISTSNSPPLYLYLSRLYMFAQLN